MNRVKFFTMPRHLIRLTRGTNNNILEIGYLENAVQSDPSDVEKNRVYLSFRGEELEQILSADLDLSGNENKWSYETIVTGGGGRQNIIKLAVDKMAVDTLDAAKKYITGLLVDYLLEDLVYSNSANNPLYNFKALLSDGSIISLAEATTMTTIVRKMEALDKDSSLNKIGYNKYEITRAIIKK